MIRDEAIAICRVSTPEQKKSNSLKRQADNVKDAAKLLGVKIVKTWSGDTSSKVGKNYKRTDLIEAFLFCKNNRKVQYLVVDEVDRFMRSVPEMFYWITKFHEEVGVKVYFASNPELNSDDARSRLLLSLDGFKAEGSNEERQKKSISGHQKAIGEGRYTFPPKPGYMKGSEPGVHIPNPLLFDYLKKAYRMVSSHMYTPQEALKWLNSSDFTKHHAPWAMDKFRHFAIDPYYAGVLKIGKQINQKNDEGLHEPMITIEEHEQLKQVFSGSIKHRDPKKHYNPEFPMNNLLYCADCSEQYRFTGSKKNNGYAKKVTRYYWKYHCRGCGKAYHRKDVHSTISAYLSKVQLNVEQKESLVEALSEVWESKQKDKYRQLRTSQKSLKELESVKSNIVLKLVSAEDSFFDDLEEELIKIKVKINKVRDNIKNLYNLKDDLVSFIKYALEYTNNLVDDWWKLNKEERERCQQLLFPGGITFNSQKKVGTPKISPIYRLEPNKKDLSFSEKSLMVELVGTAPTSAGLYS